MKNKKEQIIKDPELYERLKEHLYSKKPVLGEGSPFSEMLQKMVNTVLDGEIESFLTEQRALGKNNKRNGTSVKKVRSSAGDIWIETPRDRSSEFEPEIVRKRQRELTSGLDEQIIALYDMPKATR